MYDPSRVTGVAALGGNGIWVENVYCSRATPAGTPTIGLPPVEVEVLPVTPVTPSISVWFQAASYRVSVAVNGGSNPNGPARSMAVGGTFCLSGRTQCGVNGSLLMGSISLPWLIAPG